MTHVIDEKKRTDNIWNLSIFIVNNNDVINIDDIVLVCNLFDTIKRGYDIKNYDEMLKIYKNINILN